MARFVGMTNRTILETLPSFYGKLLPEFFNKPLPEEELATCDQCAMCQPEGEPELTAQSYYSPDSKCCTFHPNLPNYSVGALLIDDDPAGEEGRRRLRAKIDGRSGIYPHGIVAPPKYELLFERGTGTFGRNESLLCPYFERDGGTCTIWAFRETVCSTYFCKHNAGADGQAFWASLSLYLHFVQRRLIDHILYRSGWEVSAAATLMPSALAVDGDLGNRRLTPNDLDERPPSDAVYAACWGEWVGREEEFYRRAHAIVEELDQESFERIAGVGQWVRVQELASKYERMVDPQIPEVLLRNPGLRVSRDAEQRYVLSAGSQTDMKRVRKEVYDVVEEFDGLRTTSEILEIFELDRGVSISTGLLVGLVQHRILIDPAELNVVDR
jgi:hypothetical protein